MSEISSWVEIRQDGPSGDDGAWPVRVVFPGGEGEYVARVARPGTDADEEELSWYFEEHLRFPFLDGARRDRAAAWVARYGRELFSMVFVGDAWGDYRRLRDGGFDGVGLRIVGELGFHGLHWETMCDPDGGSAVAIRVPVVRQVRGVPKKFDLPGPQGVLRVLAVTARPAGAGDVGHRTISGPLVDAVSSASLPVQVEFVRPGTWEAFRDRVRELSRLHGSGFVQAVHFDVHGLFADPCELADGVRAGEIAPLQGDGGGGPQGFVFFETAVPGQARAVPAGQVAELLADNRVAVVVLNACQSAMQGGDQASLALELARNGVPVTVGMAYSVTVTAAVKAMPVLYKAISDGMDPAGAVRLIRQELVDDPARQGYYKQQVRLEDWMLPVVFSQRPVSLRLRDMTAEELTAYYQNEAGIGVPPAPRFGFYGRDVDIQLLERALLIDEGHTQVLVQGMAGAGKSTLLHYLAWWWRRTGLVDQAFMFSWEDRAWTATS